MLRCPQVTHTTCACQRPSSQKCFGHKVKGRHLPSPDPDLQLWRPASPDHSNSFMEYNMQHVCIMFCFQMPAASGVMSERIVAGTKPMTGFFDLIVNMNDGQFNLTGLIYFRHYAISK